jgi:hypothetical protein
VKVRSAAGVGKVTLLGQGPLRPAASAQGDLSALSAEVNDNDMPRTFVLHIAMAGDSPAAAQDIHPAMEIVLTASSQHGETSAELLAVSHHDLQDPVEDDQFLHAVCLGLLAWHEAGELGRFSPGRAAFLVSELSKLDAPDTLQASIEPFIRALPRVVASD